MMEKKHFSEPIYYQKTKFQKETIIQKLKESGCRITKQRRILLDIMLEQDCTSCKEMYYKANKADPDIGVATVYRMVNLLEEIGVFSRKNLYKISCGMECDKENACRIAYEDNTYCELSAKEWHAVISAGMKACGYGKESKIVSVEARPCDCNF